MAYLSAYGLNWLAGKIAAESWIISAHTDEPGNAGTSNEMSTSSTGYSRKTTQASDWSATGATTDNDAIIEIFTPLAGGAGSTISHIGYWLSTNFFGWVALRAGVTTVESEPLRIAAGTADFTFSLAT